MANASRTFFKNPGRTMQRIKTVLHTWETMAPEATFSGMTLEQFKQAVRPSIEARENIMHLELALSAAIHSRTVADTNSYELASRVIYGVMATPDKKMAEGIYRAMGFIPKSERASGLTRKRGVKKSKLKPNNPPA